MWSWWLAGGLAALSILWVAYDAFGAVDPSQRHELGRRVYNFRCYFCHGYSGDARTLAATFLTPKPRDFTASALPLERIAIALREGRPGTAMKSYAGVLSERELDAVAAFVEREFVQDKAPNTAYHTEANGWPDHGRYAAAYPFARGELALDAPVESLNEGQRAGRRLFLATCVSCHDRARVDDDGPAWSARPVSFPRMGFAPGSANLPAHDAISGASVYAKHDVPPRLAGLTAQQARGEKLFQANCAFCHGADGTGKNWIGQFMEPKARDLTRYSRATLPPGRFAEVVRHGIEGSSMPAWSGVLRPDEVDAVVAYASRAFLQPHPTSAEPPVSVAPSMAPSPSSGPDADSRNREPASVWRRE